MDPEYSRVQVHGIRYTTSSMESPVQRRSCHQIKVPIRTPFFKSLKNQSFPYRYLKHNSNCPSLFTISCMLLLICMIQCFLLTSIGTNVWVRCAKFHSCAHLLCFIVLICSSFINELSPSFRPNKRAIFAVATTNYIRPIGLDCSLSRYTRESNLKTNINNNKIEKIQILQQQKND